jgi:hypothetical protein
MPIPLQRRHFRWPNWHFIESVPSPSHLWTGRERIVEIGARKRQQNKGVEFCEKEDKFSLGRRTKIFSDKRNLSTSFQTDFEPKRKATEVKVQFPLNLGKFRPFLSLKSGNRCLTVATSRNKSGFHNPALFASKERQQKSSSLSIRFKAASQFPSPKTRLTRYCNLFPLSDWYHCWNFYRPKLILKFQWGSTFLVYDWYC